MVIVVTQAERYKRAWRVIIFWHLFTPCELLHVSYRVSVT